MSRLLDRHLDRRLTVRDPAGETVVDGRRTPTAGQVVDTDVAVRIVRREGRDVIYDDGKIVADLDLLTRHPLSIGQELVDETTGETFVVTGIPIARVAVTFGLLVTAPGRARP